MTLSDLLLMFANQKGRGDSGNDWRDDWRKSADEDDEEDEDELDYSSWWR